MIIDESEKIAAAGMKIVLGIPFTRVEATGEIGNSNKNFYVPDKYAPLYPASHKDVIVKTTDVTCELLKTATYTAATVSTIKTKSVSGLTVDAGVELSAAPTAQTADKVYLSGVAACWARIEQDISPSLKRDTEELKEVGSNDVMKSYGARTRSIKSELVVAVDTLELLTDIWNEAESDQTGVGSGLELLGERDVPLELMGYIPVVYDGDEVQRYLLSGITIDEDLPTAKAGASTVKITCNLNIEDEIKVLRPTA